MEEETPSSRTVATAAILEPWCADADPSIDNASAAGTAALLDDAHRATHLLGILDRLLAAPRMNEPSFDSIRTAVGHCVAAFVSPSKSAQPAVDDETVRILRRCESSCAEILNALLGPGEDVEPLLLTTTLTVTLALLQDTAWITDLAPPSATTSYAIEPGAALVASSMEAPAPPPPPPKGKGKETVYTRAVSYLSDLCRAKCVNDAFTSEAKGGALFANKAKRRTIMYLTKRLLYSVMALQNPALLDEVSAISVPSGVHPGRDLAVQIQVDAQQHRTYKQLQYDPFAHILYTTYYKDSRSRCLQLTLYNIPATGLELQHFKNVSHRIWPAVNDILETGHAFHLDVDPLHRRFRRLLVAGESAVHVVDVANKEAPFTVLECPSPPCALTCSGDVVVAYLHNHTIAVWDRESLELRGVTQEMPPLNQEKPGYIDSKYSRYKVTVSEATGRAFVIRNEPAIPVEHGSVYCYDVATQAHIKTIVCPDCAMMTSLSLCESQGLLYVAGHIPRAYEGQAPHPCNVVVDVVTLEVVVNWQEASLTDVVHMDTLRTLWGAASNGVRGWGTALAAADGELKYNRRLRPPGRIHILTSYEDQYHSGLFCAGTDGITLCV